jgi:hypothetical protein
MNINCQALELNDFLRRYTLMWNDEIMNEYPKSLEHYPKEWIELLNGLDVHDLYSIDCKLIPSKIKKTSFAQFMTTLKELSVLPHIQEFPEIPLEDWAFNGVKKKKRHEIQKIVPVLKQLRDSSHYEYVVDIGGGVGHLSRVLSHYHGIPSISLDKDLEFQKNGQERLKKYRKIDGSRDVTFVSMNFGEKENAETKEALKNIFKPKSMALGLHTCGPLAIEVIQNTIDHQTIGLLNFGCCYHRMNPLTDFPLSKRYKNQNFFTLNLFALSLATRSHAQMTFLDYQTKERVKYYRYGLHLFLMKYFNNKFFTDVGECHIRTYWGPFAHYIRNKLQELNLTHSFSDEDFNQFYENPQIQKELREMWLCNLIRWQLGRALEVYLLLDRVFYLEECGYIAKIEQYFDELISPRNIGILAVKC